jgi:hypothetical protein
MRLMRSLVSYFNSNGIIIALKKHVDVNCGSIARKLKKK